MKARLDSPELSPLFESPCSPILIPTVNLTLHSNIVHEQANQHRQWIVRLCHCAPHMPQIRGRHSRTEHLEKRCQHRLMPATAMTTAPSRETRTYRSRPEAPLADSCMFICRRRAVSYRDASLTLSRRLAHVQTDGRSDLLDPSDRNTRALGEDGRVSRSRMLRLPKDLSHTRQHDRQIMTGFISICL